MPLDENPYFKKIMTTIDMIAADNMRRQGEQRWEERQVAREERAEERQIEAEDRQASTQEYHDLTSAIQMYPEQIKAGAEPDTDMLQSMVERRNDLIKSGTVTPRMMANIPQAPEQKQQAQQVTL